MLQLIINLLTPFFEKLGVSPVDVETYVNSMSGTLGGEEGQPPCGTLGRGDFLGVDRYRDREYDLLWTDV